MAQKKDTKNAIETGNWLLVFIAGATFLFGLALIVIGLINASAFGFWLTVGSCAAGSSSMFFSSMAIAKNDPAWLLIDLILPG